MDFNRHSFKLRTSLHVEETAVWGTRERDEIETAIASKPIADPDAVRTENISTAADILTDITSFRNRMSMRGQDRSLPLPAPSTAANIV